VLGVDRQQRGTSFLHRAQHDLAGTDQSLLVGQGHGSAAVDRGKGGGKANGTRDGGHSPVGREGRSLHDGLGTRGGVDAGTCQRLAEFGIVGRIGDHRAIRVEGYGLFGQQPRVTSGDQRANLKTLRLGRKQLDRLGSDAAGAAEPRSLPQNYSTSEGERQQGGNRRRGEHAIEAIEQPAMARNEMTRILHL
jgi:hypothetical protein